MVVTGGTRGIGAMIAGGFVAAGADVVVASRKADAVAAAGRRAVPLRGSCIRICRRSLRPRRVPGGWPRRWPPPNRPVDVLVNNAGATWGAPLHEHDTPRGTGSSTSTCRGSSTPPSSFSPCSRPEPPTDQPSRVINIGSIDGIHVPVLESYSYSASKAAVHQLTRHLAKRLAPTITVNASGPRALSNPR